MQEDIKSMLNSRDEMEPVEISQLPDDTVRKGKEIIERIKKHIENIRKKVKSPKPIYDDIYFRAIRYLDEEDLSVEFFGAIFIFGYNKY